MREQLLSIYERVVLEAIFEEEKSFNELFKELDFKPHVLQNVLNQLALKNFIQLTNSKYISRLDSTEIHETINSSQNLKTEISFLQRISLEQTIEKNTPYLKLRKVYLSSQDKSVLKAMLANLESFTNSTSKRGKLKDQNLVYWCNMPMIDVINSI